jgi:CubicO group peptidase (beta-lactamase class C family)
MAKITISYRRADSDAIAGRIRDRLASHYGENSVFMDIDSIPFGIDFREHIKAELAANDILVAVVGPKWLGPGEDARPRMHDETDPVRIEIETALQRGIPVIPVLVHGAIIPKPGELPAAMQSFAFHNAAAVDTGRDFHSHMDRLIRSMDMILKRKGKSQRPRWMRPALMAAGVCSCVLVAAGVWLYLKAPSTPGTAPPRVPAPAPSTTEAPRPPVLSPAQLTLPELRVAADDFEGVFNARVSDGYRLRTISPYVVDGAEYYAALWSKEPGPEWRAVFGVSAAQLQRIGDARSREGYRRTWISAHEFGGQVRFSGIWEKRSGAWQARFGILSGQLQSTIEELGKSGYQPVHVYGYAAGGTSNFAVIFDKTDQPPTTSVKFDVPAAEWQKTFDEQTRQGYRLKVSTTYRIGSSDFFCGLFEKTTVPGFSRSGVSAAGYPTLLNNLFYQGFRLATLVATIVPTAPRYNIIWDNTAFSRDDLGVIQGKMYGYVRTHRVPNAGLAITKDGRLVYAAGFSWWAERGNPPDSAPTGLFRLWNASEGITAVAILKLAESGKLSLADKVFGAGGILGARFATPSFNARLDRITVRQLLEHSAGFGNTPDNPLSAYPQLAPDELIRTVINEPARALVRDPGTQFEPSAFGYGLLGRVIEQVTGKGYEEYVRAAVLAPIGITDMSIGGDTQAAKKNGEMSYFPAEAYSRKVSSPDAGTGWLASPVDLARFLVRVDGLSTKPDIVSAKSYALMTTRSGVKDATGNDPNFGLGWHVNQQALWAGAVGTLAYAAVLPDGVTVAAMTNMQPATDEHGQILRNTVREIIGNVKTWPGHDLFDGPTQ